VKSVQPTTARQRLDLALISARIAHHDQDGDTLLRDAVALARSEGFVVGLADDAVELGPELARMLRSGPLGGFEQAVLARVDRAMPTPRAIDQTSLDALSPRELIVLRYLASRLTTREIAAELFVSVNTVKTHTRRIYSKLAASTRAEAITEARRRGLL
jgi:LuxR family maltose regulon positive regulatory protein